MIQNQQRKPVYKPNLDEFITQCEVNYDLIVKLLPWLNVTKNQDIEKYTEAPIELKARSGHHVALRVLEKAKYTTTMMLRIHSINRTTIADISLMVRLYHDAQLLEVMDKVGPKALKPNNTGSNLRSKQVDEKRQLNRFVGESLRFLLQE